MQHVVADDAEVARADLSLAITLRRSASEAIAIT
jgi:hypothetical protein